MTNGNFEARSVPCLQGARVVLRPPIEGDVEARLALGNDPEIHRMFGGSRDQLRPLTREGAGRWMQRVIESPYGWVIERGSLIGEIRLIRVERIDRRASLAVGIVDPRCLDKGYGTEAIRLVLDYAFGELKLHRISLRVLAYNQRAIRAYQKCGFVIEGREREVDGEWHDDITMGILEREFRTDSG